MEIARLRYLVLSGFAGLVWGGVAFLFGHRAMGSGIWAGVMVSPLIGLSAGALSWPFRGLTGAGRLMLSVATLYLSGIVFGAAVGIGSLAMHPDSGRAVLEVLWEPILTVLWGMTLTGYFILFLPMTYFTHWLLALAVEKA